jgi:hypothetical protein
MLWRGQQEEGLTALWYLCAILKAYQPRLRRASFPHLIVEFVAWRQRAYYFVQMQIRERLT